MASTETADVDLDGSGTNGLDDDDDGDIDEADEAIDPVTETGVYRFDGLLLTVIRTIVIEETVPGAIIAVEFIIFAIFFEFCFVQIDLFRGWAAIVVAKETQNGTGKVCGVIDRCDREISIQVRFCHHNPSAPAFHDCIQALYAAAC